MIRDAPPALRAAPQDGDRSVMYRFALAAVWMLLGVLKAASPHQLAEFIAASTGLSSQLGFALAVGVAALEVLLAVVIATVRGRAWPFVLATVVGVLLVAWTLFGAESTHACGCFGGSIVATQLRKQCVAWALLFLAVGATRAHQARVEQKESTHAG